MKHLEFPVHFDTGETVAIQLGRIHVGKGEGYSTIRLVLKPDGLHVYYQEGCPFVHAFNEANSIRSSLVVEGSNETP